MVLDFFRFMYSDEGIQIVLDYSKSYLPIVNSSDFVYNGTPSTFRQSVNKIASGEITYLFTSSRDPIRYRAGVDSFLTTEKPETALGKRFVIMDNWNEWGEGHYIAPHLSGGFKYLQAIREVFTKRDNLPDYRTPQDLGFHNLNDSWEEPDLSDICKKKFKLAD